MRIDDPELIRQAYWDITMRTRTGISLYLVIWLIVAYWHDLYIHAPLFFELNTGIILGIMIMRCIHYAALIRKPSLDREMMYRWLAGMVMLSGLHWGLMSSWVIHSGDFPTLRYPFIIIIAAMAMGVTINLSISKTLSQYYLISIFAPHMILGIREASNESLALVCLACIAMIYVRVAARVIHDDYWNSIRNHRLLEAKAIAMEKLSVTDQLTGLFNRLHFNDRFAVEWRLCRRLELPLSLMIIDLDYFKKINDTYGHMAGDACLRQAAVLLRSVIKRETDMVARFGGEEFVVVMPSTDLTASRHLAEKLLAAFASSETHWQETRIRMTCSIGLACVCPGLQLSEEDLLEAADQALYQAKEEGRNRYCIAKENKIAAFSPPMPSAVSRPPMSKAEELPSGASKT